MYIYLFIYLDRQIDILIDIAQICDPAELFVSLSEKVIRQRYRQSRDAKNSFFIRGVI